VKNCNGKLREEFLNEKIFYSMKKLCVLAKRCRVHSNTVKSHSLLGYRTPVPVEWLSANNSAV
jgi:hypothetical protein